MTNTIFCTYLSAFNAGNNHYCGVIYIIAKYLSKCLLSSEYLSYDAFYLLCITIKNIWVKYYKFFNDII